MSIQTSPIIDIILGLLGIAALVWMITRSKDFIRTNEYKLWAGGWGVILGINILGFILGHDWRCIPWMIGSVAAFAVIIWRWKNNHVADDRVDDK